MQLLGPDPTCRHVNNEKSCKTNKELNAYAVRVMRTYIQQHVHVFSFYWLLSSPARIAPAKKLNSFYSVFTESWPYVPPKKSPFQTAQSWRWCSTACKQLSTWLGTPSHAPARTALGFYWQAALSATCSLLDPGEWKHRSQSIATQTLTGNPGVQQMGPCTFSCALVWHVLTSRCNIKIHDTV